MPIQTSDTLTPRESLLLQAEQEENRLSREFALAMKDKEIALAKLESKWASWLKIPLIILRLPVMVLMVLPFGVAYVISMLKKTPIDPDTFWQFLK